MSLLYLLLSISLGGKPNIDIDRLEKIAKKVSIPLVLHGGSGTGENSLKKCIKLGISKINICTDLMVAATEGIKESLKTTDNFGDINLVAEAAIKECLTKYYKMFNCLNRI
ncbi:class II fructose-bisphosphate aldolase [Tepidimicrobium xylanilyticum]